MIYPPLILFSTINSISILVNNSNFTSVFFKHACHANAGADTGTFVQVHLFLKFSNTSASNNVSL